MGEHQTEPTTYLAERAHQALAEDPRTATMDIRVTVTEHTVVLTGSVTTHERRIAAEEVVREALPGYEILNRMIVGAYPPPEETERVS